MAVTSKQTLRIIALLNSALIERGNRLVAYKEGQDDASIAAQISTRFKASSVAAIRKDAFGTLENAARGKEKSVRWALNGLIDLLYTNDIVDGRHFKVD